MTDTTPQRHRLSPETGRLATIIIAILDHFVETKATMPAGIHAMLQASYGALNLNEDTLSREIVGYFQAVLEDEQLTAVPAIAKALQEGQSDATYT